LGEQPEVMLLYAEALAYVDHKNLAGKPAALINKALTMEPDNVNALWLGGMVKMQQNDIQAGLKLWHKLASLLPPDSEAQQQIQSLLAKMETPETVTAPVKPVKPAESSAVTVSIEVSLAPSLKNTVDPNATVFIYAQALAGPKMPLAIVRKLVADLPVTVTLNDSLAMMPEIKLSNFTTVRLLARISKSGTAQAQQGDLIGMIDQASIAESKHHYKIIIDSVVK
jgi:cytochrome c-type biogenesis protein CcmH